VCSTVHPLLQEMALCAEIDDSYWSLLMQLYTLACAYVVIAMVVCVWRWESVTLMSCLENELKSAMLPLAHPVHGS
jgi:hypothetical protein